MTNQCDDVAKVAEGLPSHWISALLQFQDEKELLEAENDDEVRQIREMMKAGLVGYIRINGRIFMDLRPFGIAVRNHLQQKGSSHD